MTMQSRWKPSASPSSSALEGRRLKERALLPKGIASIYSRKEIEGRRLLKRIRTLHLSPSMQARFEAFAERPKPSRWLFGIPLFSPRLPKGVRGWTYLGSLSFVYYFYKGMWRKGLLTLVLMLLASFALSYVTQPEVVWTACDALFSLEPISEDFWKLCLRSYNNVMKLFVLLATYQMFYDSYRHSVLREKFWW